MIPPDPIDVERHAFAFLAETTREGQRRVIAHKYFMFT
jgi:hypothetical protein